ncbi:MAG: helix-turn-helix domain-containing protein [Candidatus Cloacimonetes bacterium]|nr:helix-turn-helix domain-containing protein [Actinomycetota bacterium]MBL7086640.1 helix-turn-helix domain-containing protein [Candidatus Cloacimonadota bacterium]
MEENNGRLEVLNDKSKIPKNKRKPDWDPRVVDFIRNLRKQYPRLGKDKIKPFLEEFCQVNSLKVLSESAIGGIITNKQLFFHPQKITHFGKIVKTEYRKKLRRKGYQNI